MFDRPEQLLEDIDSLSVSLNFPAATTPLPSSEVGQGVIMLALGRMPGSAIGLQEGEKVSEARQQTARQLIAKWFLAPESSMYSVLGASPDCPADLLRDNYRRLIGLVHPDTRPVGFPEDSASRVNLAYSILADAEKRAAYDVSVALLSQQSAAPVSQGAAPPPTFRSSVDDPGLIDRFRAAVPKVRFGQGLLVVAGLMLLPIGFATLFLTGSEPPPQIVATASSTNGPETSSVRAGSANLTGSSVGDSFGPAKSSGNAPVNAPDPMTDKASPPATSVAAGAGIGARLRNLFGATNSASTPTTAALPTASKPNESPRVSAALPSLAPTPSVASAAVETAAPTSVRQPASVSLAPSVAPAERTVAATSPASDAPATVASIERPARASSTPPSTTPQTTAAAPPAVASVAHESKVNAADADDILLKLGSAYESGSIAAFGRILAPAMAGRRQLLSDYERVFQQTRQRSIRFAQFKHKPNGDRMLTSGYATVSMIDNNNQQSNQRIFLEIDIGREAEGPRIERMLNYPLN